MLFMKVSLCKSDIGAVRGGLLAVLVFKGRKLPKEAEPFTKGLTEKQFDGKLLQTYSTSTLGKAGFGRLLLVGLGEEKELELDFFRRAAGTVVRHSNAAKIKSASIMVPDTKRQSAEHVAQALAEGAILSGYSFTQYKTDKKDMFSVDSISLISKQLGGMQKGIDRGTVLAEAQNYVREMDEQPANVMTPDAMVAAAKALAKNKGFAIKVLDEKEMKRKGMNGILAVGQGSVNPPRLIVLEYNRGKPKLPLYAIVGKGVAFDSGGISIKPSKGMHEMKYDKTGALLILGAMRAASELKLPIRLVGLMPCVENMPSGSAQKPGDIVAAYNGKTIEVLNTDAEGRMILADALAYAAEMKPKAMVDVATLTGAILVALGNHAIGLFCDDTRLSEALEKTGKFTHERVWRFPMWKEYGEMIKSDFADIKNISDTGYAGSITAAMFLKEFVGETKWAHLDIAGVDHVSGSHPYMDKGASGTGVRLMVETLVSLSKK